jgi:hypothetical protein
MNVHNETLRQIQLFRSVHDPVVPHPGAKGWLSFHERPRERYQARRERLRRTPAGERMELATLPETVTWAQTASADGSMITAEFTALFSILFKTYMTERHGFDSDGLMEKIGMGAMGDPEDDGPWPNPTLLEQHNEENGMDLEPTDTDVSELLTEWHRNLKLIQDKHFVERIYDDLPFDTSGVPKAFWEVPIEQELPDDDGDKSGDAAQTGLEAF